MDKSIKEKGKATPEQEADLIQEIQRLIDAKELNVALVSKNLKTEVGSGCTTCTMCPCMFIG